MISRILGLIFVMIFSLRASAGVYIEPVLGYAMGTIKNSAQTIDTTGLMYGGRGGFSTMGFDIGAEYLMGTLEGDISGVKGDNDHTYISAYVGYSLPIMLAFRAGYVFSNKVKTSTHELTGSGFSFGVSYSIMPFVKLNFDYKMLEHDKAKEISSGTETTATGAAIYENNEMFFSLSVPVGF